MATDHVWTVAELFQRNIGTQQEQRTQFPPHRIIGNLYYVGTQSLSSFVIDTPQGDILIVPPWAWHFHENAADQDAILYSIGDWPAMKALALYREEQR